MNLSEGSMDNTRLNFIRRHCGRNIGQKIKDKSYTLYKLLDLPELVRSVFTVIKEIIVFSLCAIVWVVSVILSPVLFIISCITNEELLFYCGYGENRQDLHWYISIVNWAFNKRKEL